MFSRKKKIPSPRKRGRTDESLSFGLGLSGIQANQDENDSDLEAELFALTGEKSTNSDITYIGGDDDDDLEAELARIIGKEKGNNNHVQISHAKKDFNNLQTKECVGVSDDETDDVDENDPELLSELKMLTNTDLVEEDNDKVEESKRAVSQLELITERLTLYKTAESNAKSSKDLSRVRRYSRGIKTLEQLKRKAEAGVFVPYNEIPPEITTNLKSSPSVVNSNTDSLKDTSITEDKKVNTITGPSDQTPENTPSHHSIPNMTIIQDDFSKLNVFNNSKEDNEESVPQKPITTVIKDDSTPVYDNPAIEKSSPLLELLTKRRDEFRTHALAAKKSGDLPLALGYMRDVKTCDKLIMLHKSGSVINKADIPQITKNPSKTTEAPQAAIPSGVSFISGDVFSIPKTVHEALNQRLNYYIKAMRKAESAGQRSDLRKIENIVKIYQNAIKLHSKGGDVPFQKLPNPPGCPPIPLTFKAA